MNPKKLVMFATEHFDRLSAAGWIPALLMRLFVGYFFMETGWAKIHNLDAFTTRFAQWGIPHPAFNAALSAYTEFLGGALTILGLGMRFVSIPMIINMLVALIFANSGSQPITVALQQQVRQFRALLHQVDFGHSLGLALEVLGGNANQFGQHVARIIKCERLVKVAGENVAS